MKARVEYQAGNEQSDYKAGALTIHCTDVESSFELGLLFAQLSASGKEAVYLKDQNHVAIRIPVIDRKVP